jgi:hypothetical protein
VGKDISITFPSAKNDQLHMGRSLCLITSQSDFCPVLITKLLFLGFGLCFGTTGAYRSFGNFRIQRESLLHPPHTGQVTQRLTGDRTPPQPPRGGWRCVRAGATDKSVKMSGVTAAFTASASSKDVMHIGR